MHCHNMFANLVISLQLRNFFSFFFRFLCVIIVSCVFNQLINMVLFVCSLSCHYFMPESVQTGATIQALFLSCHHGLGQVLQRLFGLFLTFYAGQML